MWLKEGDKCTKIFNKMTNSYRRNNDLEFFHLSSIVLQTIDEIQYHNVKFYEELFVETIEWYPNLDGLSFRLYLIIRWVEISCE